MPTAVPQSAHSTVTCPTRRRHLHRRGCSRTRSARAQAGLLEAAPHNQRLGCKDPRADWHASSSASLHAQPVASTYRLRVGRFGVRCSAHRRTSWHGSSSKAGRRATVVLRAEPSDNGNTGSGTADNDDSTLPSEAPPGASPAPGADSSQAAPTDAQDVWASQDYQVDFAARAQAEQPGAEGPVATTGEEDAWSTAEAAYSSADETMTDPAMAAAQSGYYADLQPGDFGADAQGYVSTQSEYADLDMSAWEGMETSQAPPKDGAAPVAGDGGRTWLNPGTGVAEADVESYWATGEATAEPSAAAATEQFPAGWYEQPDGTQFYYDPAAQTQAEAGAAASAGNAAASAAAGLSPTATATGEALGRTTLSSTLSSRFIESVPTGLDPKNWNADDPFSVLSSLPDDEDYARMAFKLELDDATAESVIDAAGVIVSPAGDMSIVLPSYGPCVIGAASKRGSDVVLDEARVSGRHVFFEVVSGPEGEAVFVTDAASTNGVYRNSGSIRRWESVRCMVGDEIALGARAVAKFRICEADYDDLKETSMISARCIEIREAGFRMSYTAWVRNLRQRTALGLFTFPMSITTETALSRPEAADLCMLPTPHVGRIALPQALKGPNHESFVAMQLRQGRVKYAETYLQAMSINYPTRPQVWLLTAQLETFYFRQYAVARKTMHAAYEALEVAEGQLASVASAGYAMQRDKKHMASLRVEVMVHGGVNEWRAKLFTCARRLWQEAKAVQAQASIEARELLYWTWAHLELEDGNVDRCLKLCNKGFLETQRKSSSIVLLQARAMHQNGSKTEAYASLEKLARRHAGSHAVALTHIRLLRQDDPQEAALLAQRFLADQEALVDKQPSAVRAAMLAEAAICYVAVGALADAVDALAEAIKTAGELDAVAAARRAAARADDALRKHQATQGTAVDTATALASATNMLPSTDAGTVAQPAPNDSVGSFDEATHEEVAEAAEAAAAHVATEVGLAVSKELDLWRQAAAPTALAGVQMRTPKLHIASQVGAAKEESGWLAKHITAAQISLAGALVIHDARMARQMAVDAVTSGKLQPQAHDAAAQACVAMRDFGEAVRHVTAGLKVGVNHTGLLRTFARLLREQGNTQDAVLVATYARDVALKGPGRVSGSVREAFFGIRESVLGI